MLMVDSDERGKALDKARKLIALASGNANSNEARSAALAAVNLIREHQLLDIKEVVRPGDLETSLTDEVIGVLVAFLLDHPDQVVSLSSIVTAVLEKRDVELEAPARRRVYHRSRWRLIALVQQDLLEVEHQRGFCLPDKPDLRALREIALPTVWS